jgi:predicted SAM-dependent methyltransferase
MKSGQEAKRKQVRKLHLGCFDQKAPGWINTDITPHIFIARIPGAAALLFAAGIIPRTRYEQHKRGVFSGVRYMDIRKRFTLQDDSIDCAYSSHVLEHLYREDATRCISEIHRVMRPGGIVRCAVPDLDSLIGSYDPLHADEFAHAVFESRSRRTKNEHHWMYNSRSLSALLSDAGLVDIRQCGFREGDCPDLDTIEIRADSLFIEAKKAAR